MKAKSFYLILFVVGTIIPYYFFSLFLIRNGLNLRLLIEQLSTNNISLFFSVDVIIAAIALIFYILHDRKRIRVSGYILAILATLTIGVSSGLPLYFYLKEKAKERISNI